MKKTFLLVVLLFGGLSAIALFFKEYNPMWLVVSLLIGSYCNSVNETKPCKKIIILTLLTLWLSLPMLVVGFLFGIVAEAGTQGFVYARKILSKPIP